MATIKKGRPRKDGSVPWVLFYVDQDGTDRIKTFDRYKDAKRRKLEVEQEVSDGTHTPDRASCTVADACELLLRRRRAEGRSLGTIERYRTQMRLYILRLLSSDGKPLGKVLLSKLTHAQADDYCLRLLETAPPYVAVRTLRVLKAAVYAAMKASLVGQNVFAGCQLPRGLHKPRGHEVGAVGGTPTRAELNLLLDNSTGRLRAMIFTCSHAGLRPGEMRALVWDDHIDFAQHLIHVRQAVKAWTKEGRRSIGETKTGDQRDQPMPSELEKELKEWRLQCPKVSTSLNKFYTTEEKAVQIAQYIRTHDDVGEDRKKRQVSKLPQKDLMERFGVAGETIVAIRRVLRQGHPFAPTGRLKYVFPNEKGGILHESTFEVQFKALQVKLGIVGPDGEAKYSPYGLRHCYGSVMAKEAELPDVQKLMGHRRLSTTVGYVHGFGDAEERATKVAAAFGSLRSLRQK